MLSDKEYRAQKVMKKIKKARAVRREVTTFFSERPSVQKTKKTYSRKAKHRKGWDE